MKYYAVKKGLVPGVYATWDECKDNVIGYAGAVYKSFSSVEEAEAFLNDDNKPDVAFRGMHIFYKLHGDTCEVPIIKKTFRGSCTLDAELKAVVGAVKELYEQGNTRFRIHYKNDGVVKWYDGSWSPKSQMAMDYSSQIHALVSQFDLYVEFVKQR